MNKDNDKVLIDAAITIAEDERNAMENHNKLNGQRITIDETTTETHKNKKTIRHRGKNMGNAFSTANCHRINSFTCDGNHVHIRNSPIISTYHLDNKATTLT